MFQIGWAHSQVSVEYGAEPSLVQPVHLRETSLICRQASLICLVCVKDESDIEGDFMLPRSCACAGGQNRKRPTDALGYCHVFAEERHSGKDEVARLAERLGRVAIHPWLPRGKFHGGIVRPRLSTRSYKKRVVAIRDTAHPHCRKGRVQPVTTNSAGAKAEDERSKRLNEMRDQARHDRGDSVLTPKDVQRLIRNLASGAADADTDAQALSDRRAPARRPQAANAAAGPADAPALELPVMSITEVRQSLGRILARFRNEGVYTAPVIFGAKRQPEAVLLSAELFDLLQAVSQSTGIRPENPHGDPDCRSGSC